MICRSFPGSSFTRTFGSQLVPPSPEWTTQMSSPPALGPVNPHPPGPLPLVPRAIHGLSLRPPVACESTTLCHAPNVWPPSTDRETMSDEVHVAQHGPLVVYDIPSRYTPPPQTFAATTGSPHCPSGPRYSSLADHTLPFADKA